jgi:hypothetical protein
LVTLVRSLRPPTQAVRRLRCTGATFCALAALIVAAGCSRQPAGAKTVVEYDPATGHLHKLAFDSDHNGTIDTVSYMDGTHVVRVELDRDENGKVERWDVYKPDGTIDYVGFASKNDGVMDSKAYYGAGMVMQRIEISTKRDGKYDRTELYENNILVRSADDTDGDGKPDKWDVYAPRSDHGANEPAYAITSTEFDDSKSGHPERRFIYGPDGSVARVEVDPQGIGAWQPMKTQTTR